MSAAANRAEQLEHRTDESTPPAGTCIPGNQEAPRGIEGARVTGTNLGSISNQGMTPLMRAACDGLAGTVRALLDRGGEVNAKRSDGFNALALAAFFGHSQVVWLLLENGADLGATGRSDTPPEMWADARGFFEIADTLREARLAEQVAVSSLSAALVDESARFARPTESEKPQPADRPNFGGAAAEIDETTDSGPTLVMRPAPLAEESNSTNGESIVVILPTDKPRPIIEQPLKNVRTLPEIEDTPPLVVPRFHPGSAFVSRIASSRKNLMALILAVLLGTGIVAFLFPQIRKSLGERQTATVSTTNLPTGPSNPVDQSGTSDSGTVQASLAPATKPADAPASNQDQHESAATSVARSGTRARKQRADSRAIKSKEQTVAEEQPKPAPLSVETSRSRSVLSPPVGAATDAPSSQPPPSSIISGKPKSKVIQWP